MFLWLSDCLAWPQPSELRLVEPPGWETIPFRASLAAIVGFTLVLLVGRRMIGWLRLRFPEPIKGDSPRLCRMQREKGSTPTMGGLFLVAGVLAAVIVLGDLASGYLHAALVVAVGLAAVGLVDDLAKLRPGSNGISARSKLLGQILVATAATVLVYRQHVWACDGLALGWPLVEAPVSLGLWFIPLAVIVIVGFSNAVNLTDGLDGMAGGCLLFAAGGMTLVACAIGDAEWAGYLNLPHFSGVGEVTILGGAMLGGVLGFLWFNCHPARVFMGDTGSLPLGGLLGLLAVVTRQELLLLLIGGVFVAEAASVVLQVGWYKWRGERILLCAPLHLSLIHI